MISIYLTSLVEFLIRYTCKFKNNNMTCSTRMIGKKCLREGNRAKLDMKCYFS